MQDEPTPMDCEKFESVLADELHGRLDDVTSAAMARHAAGCGRCASLLGGLRATRRIAAVPIADTPARTAAAAAEARRDAPLEWKVAHVVSLAGSWAMRPQTAMAAVFMVMIGTSLLLLRGRSSRAPASAEMTVTEEGTPAPAIPAPSSSTGETGQALTAVAPEFSRARVAKPAAGADGGAFDAAAALAEARASRDDSARRGLPCPSVARFDDIASRAAGTPAGWDAVYESALCYESLGDFPDAKSRLGALLEVDAYRERARTQLDELGERLAAAADAGGKARRRTTP